MDRNIFPVQQYSETSCPKGVFLVYSSSQVRFVLLRWLPPQEYKSPQCAYTRAGGTSLCSSITIALRTHTCSALTTRELHTPCLMSIFATIPKSPSMPHSGAHLLHRKTISNPVQHGLGRICPACLILSRSARPKVENHSL